jgi:hypothetical protein
MLLLAAVMPSGWLPPRVGCSRMAIRPSKNCWPVHYAEALVTLGRYRQADQVLGQWEAMPRDRLPRSRMAALARVRGDLAARQRDLGCVARSNAGRD